VQPWGDGATVLNDSLKVSVIICTKDRPADVIRCVKSIFSQSRLPDELIVVDASFDNQLHDQLALHNQQQIALKYVRSAPGLPHQRNIGVQQASGHIIFFFDDDIVLEADYLSEVILVFCSDNDYEVGGVMGDIYELRRARETWQWWRYVLRKVFFLPRFADGSFLSSGSATWPYGLDHIQFTEFLAGGQTAYRSEVFDQEVFDENLEGYALYEDADFSYRISRIYKNIYTPRARCWHLESSGNRLQRRQLLEVRLKNFSYLFYKNFPQSLWNKLTFHLALIGFRLVPRLEYYTERVLEIFKQYFSLREYKA